MLFFTFKDIHVHVSRIVKNSCFIQSFISLPEALKQFCKQLDSQAKKNQFKNQMITFNGQSAKLESIIIGIARTTDKPPSPIFSTLHKVTITQPRIQYKKKHPRILEYQTTKPLHAICESETQTWELPR